MIFMSSVRYCNNDLFQFQYLNKYNFILRGTELFYNVQLNISRVCALSPPLISFQTALNLSESKFSKNLRLKVKERDLSYSFPSDQANSFEIHQKL